VTGSAKIVLVQDEAFQREVIAECLAQHGLRPTALSSRAELNGLLSTRCQTPRCWAGPPRTASG
jgi:CheY-like chemotaxis protein